VTWRRRRRALWEAFIDLSSFPILPSPSFLSEKGRRKKGEKFNILSVRSETSFQGLDGKIALLIRRKRGNEGTVA
jgi:hypothetical protein